jgi:RND family efflux transporter MFP subunit
MPNAADSDLSRLRIDRAAPPPRPRRRRKLLLGGGLALLLAAALLAARLGGEREVDSLSVSTAYPYQAVTALNAAGYVVASRKAALSTKATGRLEWLGVLEGSQVKAGEVIARLESKDVRAQAEQQQANVKMAQAELTDAKVALARSRDLASKKYLSAAALDAAQARYDKAVAGVAVAAANARVALVSVEQTEIRAPFDAVVLTKSANVGDNITPFSSAVDSKGAVVTIADMASLEVEADVSESNLAKISVGQPCEIQLDAFPSQRFRGEVSRLVPTVDRSKATVLAKVRLIDRDPRILPEMSAKIAFLDQAMAAGERQVLTVVHQDALTTRDGRSGLFVIADGHAKWLALPATVRKINELVVIDGAGLKVGDKVVARPADGLKDGDRIKLAQK